MKIYCITNSINGKRYIGQTVQSIEARWKQHCTRNGLRLIGAAIKEHGAAAFSIEHLCEAASQSELNRLEQLWIERLNTIAPSGYNLSAGGGSGGKMSDETRALMRERAARPERIALARKQLQNETATAKRRKVETKTLQRARAKRPDRIKTESACRAQSKPRIGPILNGDLHCWRSVAHHFPSNWQI